MNNLDKKNYEEQGSKVPARLFDLHCAGNRHSSAGSVFVKLKTYNNEKEHGNGRPGYQSDNRCNYRNTLFYRYSNWNFGHCTLGSGRSICAYKFNQLLSALCTFRTENMSNEKRRKAQQLTKYKSKGGFSWVRQVRNTEKTR